VLRRLECHNPTVVDLSEDVLLNTTISQENHAALRAGFAGYLPNPRWSVTKFRAWRTGRQLREALARGEMTIRASDRMLIPTQEEIDSDEESRSQEKQLAAAR
jgi:hypothetical protein